MINLDEKLKKEHIRDMHNHYLVLKGLAKSTRYNVKMILNNTIPGLLKTELRCIDDIDLYYYDITSKKSVSTIYESRFVTFTEVKNLLESILFALEISEEYLLSEKDFIISPDYVYLDAANRVSLCHLVGYNEEILMQLSSFIEFLMNKVDYKDEAAVVLVYAVYKESKEVECTFTSLREILNKSYQKELKEEGMKEENILIKDIMTYSKDGKEEISKTIKTFHKYNQNHLTANCEDTKKKHVINKSIDANNKTPKVFNYQKLLTFVRNGLNNKRNANNTKEINESVLEEVMEKDVELQYYGKSTFLLAGLVGIGAIVIIFLTFYTGILYNSLHTGLDPVKVTSVILITLSLVVYGFTKIFNPLNKKTRIVTKTERLNNETEEIEYKKIDLSSKEANPKLVLDTLYLPESTILKSDCNSQDTLVLWSEGESDEDKTVLLTDLTKQDTFYLVPKDSENRNEIEITEFPFMVGKQMRTSSLYINESSVSRKHAVLTKEGNEIYIMDLSSTNGTYINGQRIPPEIPQVINHSDEICFANMKYLLKSLD